jgi:hypothetical protein
MALLDPFHPPLSPHRHWESFHVNWAGAMADVLNERLLPEGYFAEEHVKMGPRVEIDIATRAEGTPAGASGRDGATATLPAAVWTAPPAPWTIPAEFPDSFEVLVFESEGGASLVAAIELVSPRNKDRPEARRAFAVKCASYLGQGIGLVVIDVVTTRLANLHNEMMRLLEKPETFALPTETSLYAVAYRPVVRGGAEQIDAWPASLAVGQMLPVLPLALNAELLLPLDLEGTYMAARQRRRLT